MIRQVDPPSGHLRRAPGGRAVFAIVAIVVAGVVAGVVAATVYGVLSRSAWAHDPIVIHVRWKPDVTDARRAELERGFRLTGAERRDGTTWKYVLGDASTSNLRSLIGSDAVDDTARLNRVRYRPEFGQDRPRQVIFYSLAAGMASVLLVALVAGLWRLRSDAALFAHLRDMAPLAGLLLVSLLLRMSLVWSGGAGYWPDEGRYDTARDVTRLVLQGRANEAAALLDSADTLLFRVLGVVPALVEFEFTASGDFRIPASFFALFSLLNIWLVGRVALRLGADRAEALFASVLMALSTTLFYWARHLVPYDLAMTLGLLALHAGARRPLRGWSSVCCGCLAASTFVTYAAYWTLGGAALLVHAAGAEDWRDFTKRALLGGLGLALTIGALLAVDALRGGEMIDNYTQFAGEVNQGTFAEGWRLPFEYLWHAEHWLLIAWAASALWWGARIRVALTSPRVVAGLIGVLFIYAALSVFSVFLERFVVYGRLARQLVPFFCLLTAAALAHARAIPGRHQRWVTGTVFVFLFAQAGWNFREPLRQSFPVDFESAASDRPDALVLYASHIYPSPKPVRLPPRYIVLKEARHPLQFLPYQYEGYTPDERRILRTTDIRMRVLAPQE